MSQPSTAGFLSGTRQKVIAVFLIALLAIGLAAAITYFSFSELLQTVDRLAEPNAKIETLNNFFRQITSLDQELRAKALTNPRLATNTFLQESKALMAQLDTLDNLNWSDSNQHERLAIIRIILQKRNQMFLTYLQAKLSAAQNYKTSYKLDSLSQFLINYTPGTDTSIITTNQKTITTRIDPAPIETEKDKEGFFTRLFGKKKKKGEAIAPVEIEEVLSTTVDTVSILKENSAIEQIGQIVRSMEADKRQQNRIVLQREIQFIDENTKLLTQVLTILRDVEQEELERIEANYLLASELAAASTRKIAVVILIFVLCSVLLLSLIMFDITRTRYYRQQLIAAKEEAENLGKLKQQFLSNMSHEIRTPLQSIIGFSELAQREFPNDEVKAIQKASQHLLHVVNEVLDFTRIDSGRLTLQRNAFNLNTVLNDVEAHVRIQAEQKNLEFTVTCEGVSDTLLLGDAFRLRQILYNLLGNAVKFTNSGFVKLNVSVTNTTYRHACVFTVSDSGIGIAPENHGKIFREFEQVGEHQQSGSGIGLAIVKKLVEAQYGQVTIDSLPGAGAVFTVSLGFDKAPEGAVEQSSVSDDEVSHPFTGHVLVIDDDALILRYCAAVLDKSNIRFQTAQQIAPLLEQPIDRSFTHVLIDIRMPEMSGQQLLVLLREKLPSHTCFIAITAHALPQQQQQLLEAGFDAVLVKPFREQELLALLTRVSVKESQPILDAEKLLKITFGDAESLSSIVQQFREETLKDLKQLPVLVLADDGMAIREIVHKLAGRCGQMGSLVCHQKLRAIELSLENGTHVTKLKRELDEAVTAVNDLLRELTTLATKAVV